MSTLKTKNTYKIKINKNKKKTKILGKNVWGPKAWHMMHSFAIHPESELSEDEIEEYYMFYKTVAYIIPCKICKAHYKDIFDIHNRFIKSGLTRQKLQKWVWNTHNIVNRRLNKKIVSFEEGYNLQKELKNEDIYFFINSVFMQFDDKECCLYDFDNVYHFFYYFGKLYPDLKVREKLRKLINSDEFTNIESPKELKKWYKSTYKIWQS